MKPTGIPTDFKASQRIIELAKEHGWPNPQRELDAFKDYHLARGTLYVDWEAAFRTWLRNGEKWNGNGKHKESEKPKAKPRPVEPRLELTEAQRLENIRKLKELAANVGKRL